MAKSKSSTRGASHTASRNTPDTPYNLTWVDPAALEALESYDRRQWRPDKSTRPPTHQPSRFARVVETVIKVKNTPRRIHGKLNRFNAVYRARSARRQRLGFSAPRRLEMCIRRAVRGEVLHAKRKTGKAGQRKPVRNFWSAISCKR